MSRTAYDANADRALLAIAAIVVIAIYLGVI